MTGVITTGNHPKLLWPGLAALFGTTYNDMPSMIGRIFDVRTSKQAYEEIQELAGFGLGSVKAESGAITYTSTTQGPTARFTNVTYGLGFQETKESVDDNLYEGKATNKTVALARSMRHTRETIGANVFNRAFSNSYLGADGVRLISTAHVTRNGTQSNTLATDADLSEAALEDMMILIRNMTDSTGLRISAQAKNLIIPPNSIFEATRILKSTGQNDTANNAVNALKATSSISDIVDWPFLTDTDAWFITTDVPNGLIFFNRQDATMEKDSDFDTGNFKHKSVFRCVPGWGDWRGLTGSQGAS
jgi:hypothetical protein